MAYAPASLRIESVDIPDAAAAGEMVEPEVTVFNRNTQAAPGEDFDVGWVTVCRSPSDCVIWHCFVIEPQSTFVADDCTAAVSGCETEFEMLSTDVDLSIQAGGYEDGTKCANARQDGVTTDTQTVTVNAFDPARVSSSDCPALSPRNATPSDEVTATVEVQNRNAVDANATIDLMAGGTNITTVSVSVPANSTNTATIPFTPSSANLPVGSSHSIDVEVTSATPA